jgi:hypothetical protein
MDLRGEDMKTLKNDIHIDAPLMDVHNYGKDPKHWEEWYTNLQHAKIITGEGEEGTIVEFDYSIMGVHIPVKLEVVDSEAHHWVGKFSGGMNGEQIVNLIEEGDGTHAEMIYNYEMTNKMMGRIANSKIMEKMLKRSMQHTIENWKTMCEEMKY